MEEEHQGSRTPASVGFTSPTRSATPGERPSPAYRGVGAARDPDEPDHKVFEETMRLDTRGELVDIGLAGRLAHIECGPLQLAKRDRHEVLAHVASP